MEGLRILCMLAARPGQVAISDIRQQAVALGGGFKNTTVKSGGAHAAGEKRGAWRSLTL